MTTCKKIYETDPWLEPYKGAIDARHGHIISDLEKLSRGGGQQPYLLSSPQGRGVLGDTGVGTERHKNLSYRRMQ